MSALSGTVCSRSLPDLDPLHRQTHFMSLSRRGNEPLMQHRRHVLWDEFRGG